MPRVPSGASGRRASSAASYGAPQKLAAEIVAFVQRLRKEDLGKTPGVAETLDWVRALHRLGHGALPDDPHALMATLACLLKTRDDRFQLGEERVRQLIEGRRTVGVAEKAPANVAAT